MIVAMKRKTLSLMFATALSVGALQAQDLKSVEGIWFAECAEAGRGVSLAVNPEEAFADVEGFVFAGSEQNEGVSFSKQEFLKALGTPQSETVLSPKDTPVPEEAFADVEGFVFAASEQSEGVSFSKQEFLKALGTPVEMRVELNPRYVVSIKDGELLIAEISGSGFTDRYKIKEVTKAEEGVRISTTLGEEFTLKNNADGLLLTKTKSLSKAPQMQMQLSR